MASRNPDDSPDYAEMNRRGCPADSRTVLLLDHGYLSPVESWGSDERIIESARMSTSKGFLGWEPERIFRCEGGCNYTRVVRGEETAAGNAVPVCPHLSVNCPRSGLALAEVSKHPGDAKLLRYLWEHHHHTPFEMVGMTIEVQAPIFVLRQWRTHRTQSWNEQSARYVEMPEFAYIPPMDRLMAAGKIEGGNRQGSGGELSEGVAANSAFVMQECYNVAYTAYRALIAQGVANEIARCVLPVAQYSRVRMTANLRNWLHFLKLRMDSHAQWEIRQYANALGDLVAAQFPRTWALFSEGK